MESRLWKETCSESSVLLLEEGEQAAGRDENTRRDFSPYTSNGQRGARRREKALAPRLSKARDALALRLILSVTPGCGDDENTVPVGKEPILLHREV
jgi:hypothetical protein